MRIFRNAIKRIIYWATYGSNEPEQSVSNPPSVSYVKSRLATSNDVIPSTFNFSVTNAIGGKVVTVRHYNPNTDKNYEHVYIITDKEDLGEEIGQIITKESLSR